MEGRVGKTACCILGCYWGGWDGLSRATEAGDRIKFLLRVPAYYLFGSVGDPRRSVH